jgi:hypothetical protein
VSLDWVESPVPTVGEIENRHIEDKHRIMHSAAAAERFSPFARKRAWRSVSL